MFADRCRRRAGTLAACGVALCSVWVATPGRSAGATLGRSAGAGKAPAVQVMVVGRRRTLLAARAVRAARARVRVGRRRCTVAAGTPLGALAGAHGAGGPLSLRDYGHCSGSTAGSGQLFVRGIGPDRSRSGGRDGWEYKVDQRSGTTGAGDLSGPFGDGRRLRAGQHVLWFWCVMTAAGGCQRTLGLTLSSDRAAPASSVTVTVAGYDNEGRGAPVAGAAVTVEGVRASTDAAGRATLSAPRAGGRHLVSASRPGLVPAFPVALSVG